MSLVNDEYVVDCLNQIIKHRTHWFPGVLFFTALVMSFHWIVSKNITNGLQLASVENTYDLLAVALKDTLNLLTTSIW